MLIDNLINKYFEGESTCEEEKQIRLFFKQEEIPPHLEKYRAFFSFFDEEIEKSKIEDEKNIPLNARRSNYQIIRLAMIGIAACLILTFGIIGIHQYFEMPQNYVVIDGVCYTQKDLVFHEALNSLQAVAMGEDDILNTLLQDQ